MKGKAFIPLALGLGMGIVAVKLLVNTLQDAKGSTGEEQTVKVVRAVQDIGAYEEITPELVEVVETVENAFISPRESISSTDDAVGRVAAKPIAAGTPVFQSMLAPPGTPAGMVGRIPPGFRAFSVKIDEVSGVAYQLQPGDWVDVIALMDVDAAGRSRKKETISKTILEKVQLVAIGRSTDTAEGTGSSSKIKPAKSATLLVPKEEIPKLHLWQTRGKLTLAMRGTEDEGESEDVEVARGSELFNFGDDEEPEETEQQTPPIVARVQPVILTPKEPPHSITIYRGSPQGKPTEIEQITFAGPDSRRIVELRSGPIDRAEKSDMRDNFHVPATVNRPEGIEEDQTVDEPEFEYMEDE